MPPGLLRRTRNWLSPCGGRRKAPAGSRDFSVPRLPWQPGSGGVILSTGSVEGVCRQEMSSLVGKWLAPAWGQLPGILRPAGGSLVHLLSPLGEVWQALSLASCPPVPEPHRDPRASNTSNDRQENRVSSLTLEL